jgi:phosphonate transport system substrate-binding protein
MHILVRNTLRLSVAVLASLGLLQAAAAATPEARPLLFGVLNQQSPIQTAEKWNPILRYLSQKTGIPLHLKMGITVAQTDAMMGREEFDLVFTNHNFQKEYDGKYRVLAHWGGKPIHGVIAVLADSPVRDLDDLQGLVVAFPSPDAFVAYAVPMMALKEAGVSVSAKFAGNQDGALAQLKAREAAAAVVNSRFLEPYAQREEIQYRKIFVSEPYHELPVIIHPRVPAEQAAALRDALVHMHADPAAAAALAQARCPGFEPADERDYENVRKVYRTIGQ